MTAACSSFELGEEFRMFDIGTIELFIVAVVALVIVGPRELPALVRGFGKAMGTIRGLTSEFKIAMTDLAHEVERESDPYRDLRAKEGLKPGMSPEEITNTIMSNRAREASEAESDAVSGAVDSAGENQPAAAAPAPAAESVGQKTKPESVSTSNIDSKAGTD